MLRMLRLLIAFLAISTIALAHIALAQPVTIQYWHINTEAFGLPALRELIRRFESQNPDIKVEERFHANAYTGLLQNLQTALAAGNPPDVVQMGYLYIRYAAENFPFVSAEELDRRYTGGRWLKRYPPNIQELGMVDGRMVAVPYSLSNIVTYYNADLFRQAGLDPDRPPATWEGWRQAAETIKAKTGKFGFYIILLDDNWAFEALARSNGGRLLACEGGYYRAPIDSPQVVEALAFWAEMVKRGLALNAPLQQGEQAFLAGESAAFMTTIARRAGLEAQTQGRFELSGTRFPTFGDKKPGLPSGGNALMVFSKDPRKQEATWRFIQYLTSPEGFTIWSKETGYVPLLPELAQDARYLKDFVEKSPVQKAAMDQLPFTSSWGFPGKNGLAANQALFRAVQKALSGQATAESALKEASQEINRLIGSERCSG